MRDGGARPLLVTAARPEGRRREMAERRRRVIRLVVAVAVAAVLALLVYFEQSAVEASEDVLGGLDWIWIPPMLVAESGSMVAFASSQRQLLKAGGLVPPSRSMLAIAYASNALSVTLPVAGAGMATAFSYRRLRRHGVGSPAVSWALTVSGVVSSLAFGVLMTVGALITGKPAAVLVGLVGAAVTTVPVIAVLIALRFQRARSFLNQLVARLVSASRRVTGHPKPQVALAFERLLEQVSNLRATPRQYSVAFFHSMRNWVADCVCLACAIQAVGGPIPFRGLLLAYCLAVAVGSLGITPGGVGVVEVALSAALVSAGVPAHRAFPAVVLYRLVSLWLVVGVGWIAMAALARNDRARSRRTADATAAPGVKKLPPPP